MNSNKNKLEKIFSLVEKEDIENYLLSLDADESERVNNIINSIEKIN